MVFIEYYRLNHFVRLNRQRWQARNRASNYNLIDEKIVLWGGNCRPKKQPLDVLVRADVGIPFFAFVFFLLVWQLTTCLAADAGGNFLLVVKQPSKCRYNGRSVVKGRKKKESKKTVQKVCNLLEKCLTVTELHWNSRKTIKKKKK